MGLFLTLFIGLLIAFALVGYLSDKRSASGDASLTPGLKLLPGDFEYKSEDGNVRVYVPIVTSIVVSIVLSLVLSLFS